MATHKLLLLAGDGIGPEVMAEVKHIIAWLNSTGAARFEYEEGLVGGCAYDAHKVGITEETMALAHASDSVIFGAVCGPKWDSIPYEVRPESGLLRLRKDLGLFANLRPAVCYPALADSSSLKREVVEGLDIMIVRELTGGIYFGEPRGIETLPDGQRKGVNTLTYTTEEIRRIGRVAFDLARKRNGKVCSVDKANVLECTILWREEMIKLHQEEYTDIELSHMYVDNAAMQLVRNPKQVDVVVTTNIFGDILSDCAAMLTGSLGMLPSASLGATDAKGRRPALYEPVHGSAPDIAGKDMANPLATVMSFAMCLRYSFDMAEDADLIENAVKAVLKGGLRTADIMQPGKAKVSTSVMGEAIVRELDKMV